MKGSKHLYESVEFNSWLNTDPEALAMENKLGGLYPAATAGLQLPALSKGVPYYNNEKIFDVFADSSKNIDTELHLGAHPEDGEPGAAGRDGQGGGRRRHARPTRSRPPRRRAEVDGGPGDPGHGGQVTAA